MDWIHWFLVLWPLDLNFTPCLSDLTPRLMGINRWRILIPMKQCWQVYKEQSVSALSDYFVAVWRGMGSLMVTFRASSQSGLGIFQQMSKDRGIGRKTHWVHLVSYLGNWSDLVPSTVLGNSDKHFQGSLRLCGEQCLLMREALLTSSHKGGHIEENLLLLTSSTLWRPWQGHVYRRS